MAAGGGAAPLSLQRFILRSQVLAQYRTFVRALREAPTPATRAELQAEVRREFELHRGATDGFAIRYLMSDGRMRLKQLHELFGFRR